MTDEKRGSSFMLDFGSGGNPFNAVTVEAEELEQEDGAQTEEVIEDQVEDETPAEEVTEETEEVVAEEEEDESEEVEEGDESEEEGEEVEEENIYYLIGQELRQDSFLPEDFDLKEDVDALTLKTSIKENLRKELEPAIRNEVYQNLISSGYSDEDLVVARAIRQGVDPRLLSTASMYETYSKMQDDTDLAAKKGVIAQMYRTRNFNETEIENQIKFAEENENLDTLYEESRGFFKSKYDEFLASEKERTDKMDAAAREQARATNNLITNVIRNKKIKDVNMTPDQAKVFDDSIRKYDQIVEVNGQKYRASELQKFLYDFQVDDELKLMTFFLLKFREEAEETIKKEAKKEVETEFLKGYKQRVIKKRKKSQKAVVKKQETQDPLKKTGNTYTINLGR